MGIRLQFVCLVACILVGCGRTEVVTVDPSQPEPSGNVANSPSQPTDDGMTRRSSGDNRDSTANSDAGPQAAAPRAMDPDGPAVAAAPGVPGRVPAVNTPSADNAQQPPADTADPPPESSDFYVELESGRTLDIGRLLDEEVGQFEERLESIAEGENMLRFTYSDNAAPLADRLAGPAGPAGMPPASADDPARGVGIAPPRGAPGRAPGRGASPRPGLRPGPRAGGAVPAYGPAAGGAAAGVPFMHVGQIGGSLRGPTAAYRRDGSAILYVTYNRDARRDQTLIAWDAQGRPVLIDQYINGRRQGLRVLFRTRAENDPTGCVALVQEWTRGERTATHLVAEDGSAKTVDPAVQMEMSLEKQLGARLTEIKEFNSKLRECEGDLRKAVNGQNRRDAPGGTRSRRPGRAREKARAARELRDAFAGLRSGMKYLGNWRREYQRRRDIARGR